MKNGLKKLGPGLLFAGAAIGVSHLVQSTRAGADFGLGLLWALLLVNICKYPFFQFGPRYASATGESLLDGYRKLGKIPLILYFIITLGSMFTVQTAVTIVTAGLAYSIFGEIFNIEIWTIIILAICVLLLVIGKYKLLDRAIKVIIITLTISTLLAVSVAMFKSEVILSMNQILPKGSIEIAFLIAFMGWMPAPLDISVWHSLWTIEKSKEVEQLDPKSALFDFDVGYFSTIVLGICFVMLGGLVMYGSGEKFSDQGGVFAGQLIDMYTSSLGNWSYVLIGIAAFTTMFSTTLTTLDASPRAVNRTMEILNNKGFKNGYILWVGFLALGTILIFFFFASEMGLLVKIATILSFLTAPFFAIMNYWLISSKHTPKEWQPSKFIHFLSISGILFLIGFGIWFLFSL